MDATWPGSLDLNYAADDEIPAPPSNYLSLKKVRRRSSCWARGGIWLPAACASLRCPASLDKGRAAVGAQGRILTLTYVSAHTHQAYINEKAAPELLPYEEALVEAVEGQVARQVRVCACCAGGWVVGGG